MDVYAYWPLTSLWVTAFLLKAILALRLTSRAKVHGTFWWYAVVAAGKSGILIYGCATGMMEGYLYGMWYWPMQFALDLSGLMLVLHCAWDLAKGGLDAGIWTAGMGGGASDGASDGGIHSNLFGRNREKASENHRFAFKGLLTVLFAITTIIMWVTRQTSWTIEVYAHGMQLLLLGIVAVLVSVAGLRKGGPCNPAILRGLLAIYGSGWALAGWYSLLNPQSMTPSYNVMVATGCIVEIAVFGYWLWEFWRAKE